jgi:predicted nucleic acid-binding protein
MNRVLADTGPLVALLNPNDQYHEVCTEALRHLPAPLFTCWPVITEAVWLLRTRPEAVQRLLGSIGKGFLELLPLEGNEAGSIALKLKRYAAIRPQLADVALVHLADREEIDTIFTLDRRDFSIYRSRRKTRFRIVPGLD